MAKGLVSSSNLKHLCLVSIITLTILLDHVVEAPYGRTCGSGQYYNRTTRRCSTCPHGTFNDKALHDYEVCKPCTKAEIFNHEVESQACTPEHDTQVACVAGYFRSSSLHGHGAVCHACSQCKEGQRGMPACQPTSDTVCGPDIAETYNNLNVDQSGSADRRDPGHDKISFGVDTPTSYTNTYVVSVLGFTALVVATISFVCYCKIFGKRRTTSGDQESLVGEENTQEEDNLAN